MYSHMEINSKFNLVYCFICSIQLINVCVFPTSSFCSRVYRAAFSQYFKIYCVYFLGNAMQICCNVSYFTFGISRFLSVHKSGDFSRHFAKIKLKVYYALVLVSSLLLSVFKLFEYKENEAYNTFDNKFPFNAYDIEYCANDFLNSNAFYFKCRFFAALDLINNVINNVLFLFLNLCVDVALVRFTNHYLARKKQLLTTHENLDKINEAIKLKEKVNKMVITNGLLYFCSHFVEFLALLLLLVYRKKFNWFCFTGFSCTELVEMTQTFNLLVISMQMFVFVGFDSNFDESFCELKKLYVTKVMSIFPDKISKRTKA